MSKELSTSVDQAAPIISGRMVGEERRLQILQVAVRLFSQRGFRGTTTKEIAHAAGISEAMVFRHFATKDELYSAILDHKACAAGFEDPCKLVEEAVEKKDDRAVFETLALTALRQHENDTEFMRLLLHSALEGHQLAQMFWDRNVLQIYEFLSAYVEQRQSEGAFRKIEPRVVVRAFIGMIIHHSLNNSLWDPSRRLLNISNEKAAVEFTEILLRGITNANAAARTEKRAQATQTKKKLSK